MKPAFLIRNRIRKNLLQPRPAVKLTESALILITPATKSPKQIVEKFARITGVPLLNIQVISVENKPGDTEYISVGISDIAWNGKIKDKNLRKILEGKYGILFDLTGLNSDFERLIGSYPSAVFRIGLEGEYPEFYDLMLKVPDDATVITDVLAEYWDKLKIG